MSEKNITIKDVLHVAKLARLAISPEEAERYQGQLERILGYIGKLKEVNTDNVAPTAHPLDSTNVWREDQAKPFADIPALFKNAPETEETFYKVKKVIE
jgi:aspartyl-tRNA(Asn)/glutamyl-tRNA(Gln) amidotransferase subunit C